MGYRDTLWCLGPIACEYNVFYGLTRCSLIGTAKSSTRPRTPLEICFQSISNNIIHPNIKENPKLTLFSSPPWGVKSR